jgi:pimeloyl-ACP methyl ester carboxylesterase
MFAHIPRWLRIAVYTQLALVIAIPLGGWLLQQQRESADAQAFPPPGKMVDVGGYRVHVYCEGERRSGPLLVFNADSGDNGLVFRKVMEGASAFARSCAIDRAGFGWSDLGKPDRSIPATAREIHAALSGAGEKGPYVLVGHGLGALQVLGFSSAFPDDTGGAVLLDPTPPNCLKERFDGIVAATEGPYAEEVRQKLNEVIEDRGACPDGEGGTRLYSLLARIGMIRALAGRNFDPTSPSPELLELHRALKMRTNHADAVVHEAANCYVGMGEAAAALTRWGGKPFIILTKGRMGMFAEDQEFIARKGDPHLVAFEEAQLRYLNKVHGEMASQAGGTQRVAENSAHYVMLSEPELVVSTLRQAWESATSASP